MSASKVRLHLHREPTEVEAGLREVASASDRAQMRGELDLFWQQLAIEEAIAQAHVPLDRCLASAIGGLWRCGLLEQLPQSEEELFAIGARLRDACKALPIRSGGQA